MTVFEQNREPVRQNLTVTAPARLHLGFVDLHGGLGRKFVSLGMAVQEPFTRLRVKPAQKFSASGPDCDRALCYARRFMRDQGLPGALAISVEQAIPAHCGLGSGTQLALAVGSAIEALFGLRSDPARIAACLNRGARSGIGIGAFESGGFLVDGGRGSDDQPPPIIIRQPIPEHWRIVLVFDEHLRGVSGDAEKQAFAELPVFPAADAALLCRILLVQALPALANADVNRFGAAISEIQRRVGDHFAAAQGGRYVSRAVAEVLRWLETQGAAGVGQTSWGPTGFALFGDQSSARDAVRRAKQACRQSDSLVLLHCAPRNEPATIEFFQPLPKNEHEQSEHPAYAVTRR